MSRLLGSRKEDDEVLRNETKDRFQLVIESRILVRWKNAKMMWKGDDEIFIPQQAV